MALAKAGAEEEGTDAGTSMPEGTAEAARGEGEEARASPPAATQGQTSRASPPPDAQRQPTPSPDSLEARLARMEELQNRSMSTIIPILTRAVDGMRLDARIQSEGRSPGGRRQSAGTPGQDESLEAPADGSSPTRGRHTDARPGSDGTRLRDSRRDEMFRLSSVPLIETPVRVQEPESAENEAAPRAERADDVMLPGPRGFNFMVRATSHTRPTTDQARTTETRSGNDGGDDGDSEYRRDHPRLGARMGEHHGRPSSAGVRAIMGYGPRSEGSLPSRQLGPAPREPEQGKSLSLKESEIDMFTGVVGIEKGKDSALTISGCPIKFLKAATERLMERRIDPSRWVSAIINRLSPDVRTKFREHFSNRSEAVAWTLIPFAMVHHRTHPADSADWEDFWRWLLRTYLRPAHQDAAHRRWQAMEHHRSTATSLTADTSAFNEALLHADLMEHIMRRDEAWLGAPEIADTYERRRVYRAMLPDDIQLHITQEEAHAARQVAAGGDARGVGLSSTLVGEGQSQAPEFTLEGLQDAALSYALVLERDAVRAQTQRLARLNFLQAEGTTASTAASPTNTPEARLHALEAQVYSLQFDEEVGDVDQALLFNIAAQHLPSPPPPALIQQRREAGQCLACGESTSHTRFSDCPQVRSNPTMLETLRAFLRRHNADRRARGWARSSPAATPTPPSSCPAPPPPPPQSRAQLASQVNHLMDQLHHLAALVQEGEDRKMDSEDEEAGASPRDEHGKGTKSNRDGPPRGARS